jgi:hypothetical protein
MCCRFHDRVRLIFKYSDFKSGGAFQGLCREADGNIVRSVDTTPDGSHYTVVGVSASHEHEGDEESEEKSEYRLFCSLHNIPPLSSIVNTREEESVGGNFCVFWKGRSSGVELPVPHGFFAAWNSMKSVPSSFAPSVKSWRERDPDFHSVSFSIPKRT